jgi:hypothetical protein
MLIVLLLITQFSGCFFFYIPGSVIDSVLGQPKPEEKK